MPERTMNLFFKAEDFNTLSFFENNFNKKSLYFFVNNFTG